jgi:hypothetical protein
VVVREGELSFQARKIENEFSIIENKKVLTLPPRLYFTPHQRHSLEDVDAFELLVSLPPGELM